MLTGFVVVQEDIKQARYVLLKWAVSLICRRPQKEHHVCKFVSQRIFGELNWVQARMITEILK